MTGAGSLSPGPQPVTDDPATLSLYRGRCGDPPQKGSDETKGSAAGEGLPPSPIPGSLRYHFQSTGH